MSPTVRGYDDGRPALTEANREAYSYAKRLERNLSIAAAASARKRIARAIVRELEAIQRDLEAAANTSTSTSTSTVGGAGT
jgi:hypothetical protein